MALLVLLGVSILGLSRSQTRTAQNVDYQAIARSNARFALMMALDDLQRNAGWDTRVTATADIKSGLDGGDIDPSKRYLTGVWDASQWQPEDPNERVFLKWLVSGAERDTRQESYVEVPQTGDVVTLVGPGSVLVPDQELAAPRVAINSQANGNPNGAYAYAVLDNGVKANFTLASEPSPENRLSHLSSSPRHALELGETVGLNGPMSAAGGKGLSGSSLDLLANSSSVDAPSRSAFHDVTHWSEGLLTDVRRGGFKADLSSAFEAERDAFDNLVEFHASQEKNTTDFYNNFGGAYAGKEFYPADRTPDLGYVFEVPVSSNARYRGPTWDNVRNFYRIYKREHERLSWGKAVDVGRDDTVFAARGAMPLSYSTGFLQTRGNFSWRANAGCLYSKASRGRYQNFTPTEFAHGKARGVPGENPPTINSHTAPRVAPNLIRYVLGIGLVKNGGGSNGTIAIAFEPYFTIHNPYNVPIAFDALGFFHAKMNPVSLSIDWEDRSGARRTTPVTLSGNFWTNGSISTRMDATQDTYVLQPGEIKTLSPYALPQNEDVRTWGITAIRADFAYNEGSNIVKQPNSVVEPAPSSSVTLRVSGRGGGDSELDHVIFSMFSGNDHGGSPRNLDGHVPPLTGIFADTDIFDDPLMGKLSFASQGEPTIQRTVNFSQIPPRGDAGIYVAALDVRSKTASDDINVFSAFNPRFMAIDPRDYSGGDRVSPSWELDLRAITDLSELQLASDLEGHAFWGASRDPSGGSSSVVLYELPRLPMTSIAQLQHLDIAVTASGGSKHIGNSFMHAGISSPESLVDRRRLEGTYATIGPQVLIDSSWAANEALYDRYFFSGLHYGGSDGFAGGGSYQYTSLNSAVNGLLSGGDSPFFNPRVKYADWMASDVGQDQKEAELKMHDLIARHLTVHGAFNVNSTSVDAWAAVLGGLKAVEIAESSQGRINFVSGNQVPSGRFALPNAADPNDPWQGRRVLSDQEIKTLAEEMVKQVKLRGPFMGMSDFVNRRLDRRSTRGYELGKLGALQMAIESAGLNRGVSFARAVSSRDVENSRIRAGAVVRRSTMEGAPQYLMQADVLSSVGSQLTARSDSFTVRAYGECLDANGNVLSRAWCEATVQRCSDLVGGRTDVAPVTQASGYPSTSFGDPIIRQFESNSQFPAELRALGRRFKVMGFRWLNQDEV